ncbi:MAG: hypothetical protein LVQ97_00230 [Candidatus Micrarchaeales archaeon]|jgi:hypothetical protein|nr:hypothetical protein [Candidatus Micrarchaeales archaeon]
MARNIGVKQLGNTLKPLAPSRVQISPLHIKIADHGQGGNTKIFLLRKSDLAGAWITFFATWAFAASARGAGSLIFTAYCAK